MNVNPINLLRYILDVYAANFNFQFLQQLMLVTKVSFISMFIAQTSRDPIKIELSAARYIDFVGFVFLFFKK